MEDTDTVVAEARTLAAACAAAQWADAAPLRTALVSQPQHHQLAVFRHLLTLVPLNKLLMQFPFSLHRQITLTLLHDSIAADSLPAADAEPAASGKALLLPVPHSDERSQPGGVTAPLTVAASAKLFLQFTALPCLGAFSLARRDLGEEGVAAAAFALQSHAHLTSLDLSSKLRRRGGGARAGRGDAGVAAAANAAACRQRARARGGGRRTCAGAAHAVAAGWMCASYA
jgi:hypothetical protein